MSGTLVIETLVAVILLMIFVITGPVFEKIHFHYQHESGVVMLLGIAVTLLMNNFSPHHSFAKSLSFDSEIFFVLILPPIIFGAGYNLRKKFFFKYLSYILLFGVIGTAINFLLVAPFTMIVNNTYGFPLTTKMNIFDSNGKLLPSASEVDKDRLHGSHRASQKVDRELQSVSNKTNLNVTNVNSTKSNVSSQLIMTNGTLHNMTSTNNTHTSNETFETIHFTNKEILLFAAVISATDAVAALAFVREESDPKLFPILFGEGVVNDAVCIVLYQIIKRFLDSGEPFTVVTPFKMTNQFLNLFFISLGIAILVGFGSAYFFKKIKPLNINRVQELCLLIFFAFITYSATEFIHKSPIVAILFGGVFMSKYCFYNLSFQAKEESSIMTKMVSTIAEGFVFVYMGLTVFYYFTRAFSLAFVIWEFFILLICRTIMVFGCCAAMEFLVGKQFQMKFSDKGIMAYSGTIRGAIAFGLACSLELDNEMHRTVLISGTLALVLATTVILGALMPFWIKIMRTFDSEEQIAQSKLGAIIPVTPENQFAFDYSHPNFKEETLVSKEKDDMEVKKRLSTYIATTWSEFEETTLKPFLLYDYPNCIQEHDNLCKKIVEMTTEITYENKLKQNTLSDSEKKELNELKVFKHGDHV